MVYSSAIILYYSIDLCTNAKHYHEERNHQGKGNRLLFPTEQSAHLNGSIRCRESLGGLLTFYHRQAA